MMMGDIDDNSNEVNSAGSSMTLKILYFTFIFSCPGGTNRGPTDRAQHIKKNTK